jgi:hypothetical protein
MPGDLERASPQQGRIDVDGNAAEIHAPKGYD